MKDRKFWTLNNKMISLLDEQDILFAAQYPQFWRKYKDTHLIEDDKFLDGLEEKIKINQESLQSTIDELLLHIESKKLEIDLKEAFKCTT